jgi:hypothetical protein
MSEEWPHEKKLSGFHCTYKPDVRHPFHRTPTRALRRFNLFLGSRAKLPRFKPLLDPGASYLDPTE